VQPQIVNLEEKNEAVATKWKVVEGFGKLSEKRRGRATETEGGAYKTKGLSEKSPGRKKRWAGLEVKRGKNTWTNGGLFLGGGRKTRLD